MKSVKGILEPHEVLCGHDVEQDIRRLMGYVWMRRATSEQFDMPHMDAILGEFLRKYGNVKATQKSDKLKEAVKELGEFFK